MFVDDGPEVDVQVRYQVNSINTAESKRQAGRVGFVAILGCVLAIAVLIVLAVALFRKINTEAPQEKSFVPDNVQNHEDFEDMNILEEQYSPAPQHHKRGDSFGGVSFGFDRTSTAKLSNSQSKLAGDQLIDDSVKTISGLNSMIAARKNKMDIDELLGEDDTKAPTTKKSKKGKRVPQQS